MTLTMNLNGTEKQVAVRTDEMLLDVLRRLGLHSVRRGCDTAACGICTVLVEGKPVLSCSYPALRAEGKSVTTVEGVRAEAEEIGRFLTAEGVEQCGFCSPSLVLTLLSLVRENPQPTMDEVRHYMAGNLCRCSGYEGHLRAIGKYLEARR